MKFLTKLKEAKSRQSDRPRSNIASDLSAVQQLSVLFTKYCNFFQLNIKQKCPNVEMLLNYKHIV